tara:strand:- start:62513 stop:63055 length:543 start_codon:yes stop_codon:yes gene_type:complete
MPRKIPAAVLRSLYSKNGDKSLLCALTITADNEAPIYLINNEVDVEYKGQMYTSARFTIILPDDNDAAIPTSSIVFADMQNQFLDLIRNYEQIKVQVEIIAASVTGSISLVENPPASGIFNYDRQTAITTYEAKVGPYNMIMSNASGDASTATFNISIDDVAQYAFPKGTFNSTDFPALY